MYKIKGGLGYSSWSNWSILRLIHFWKVEVMYFQKKKRKKKLKKITNWQPPFFDVMMDNDEYFEYFTL